jgi:hypothetical protein
MEILEINTGKHVRGNHRCDECWQGYPVKCNCSGLIHAEYLGDAAKNGNNPMGIKCLCDKCGNRFLRAANRNFRRSNHANYNRRDN